jgi:hypothetical protein
MRCGARHDARARDSPSPARRRGSVTRRKLGRAGLDGGFGYRGHPRPVGNGASAAGQGGAPGSHAAQQASLFAGGSAKQQANLRAGGSAVRESRR